MKTFYLWWTFGFGYAALTRLFWFVGFFFGEGRIDWGILFFFILYTILAIFFRNKGKKIEWDDDFIYLLIFSGLKKAKEGLKKAKEGTEKSKEKMKKYSND